MELGRGTEDGIQAVDVKTLNLTVKYTFQLEAYI